MMIDAGEGAGETDSIAMRESEMVVATETIIVVVETRETVMNTIDSAARTNTMTMMWAGGKCVIAIAAATVISIHSTDMTETGIIRTDGTTSVEAETETETGIGTAIGAIGIKKADITESTKKRRIPSG